MGLGSVLIGITNGIQPYRGHSMGWTNPSVDVLLIGGLALLAAFVVIESRVAEPLFELALFKIRAFTAGNIAGLAVSIARGGMQFMLIIWLQGIWLPLHGYNYSDTPLYAGIFLLPLTAGMLVAGPVSGLLSDRFGARGLAIGRDGRLRRQLRRPDVPAGRLLLLGVRHADRAQRHRRRHVRRAELVIDHGQCARPSARCGLGHARDLPELRHGAVHRHLLLA